MCNGNKNILQVLLIPLDIDFYICYKGLQKYYTCVSYNYLDKGFCLCSPIETEHGYHVIIEHEKRILELERQLKKSK